MTTFFKEKVLNMTSKGRPLGAGVRCPKARKMRWNFDAASRLRFFRKRVPKGSPGGSQMGYFCAFWSPSGLLFLPLRPLGPPGTASGPIGSIWGGFGCPFGVMLVAFGGPLARGMHVECWWEAAGKPLECQWKACEKSGTMLECQWKTCGKRVKCWCKASGMPHRIASDSTG